MQLFIVHCFIGKKSTCFFLFLLYFTWSSLPIHHHPENAFFPHYLLQLGFYKFQTTFIKLKQNKLLKHFSFHLNMVQITFSCQGPKIHIYICFISKEKLLKIYWKADIHIKQLFQYLWRLKYTLQSSNDCCLYTVVDHLLKIVAWKEVAINSTRFILYFIKKKHSISQHMMHWKFCHILNLSLI